MITTKHKTVASGSELDAPLLRLTAEYIALYNEINAGLATVDGNVPDKTAERVSAMEAQIGRLPVPYTLPGIAALLRVKAACIGTRWPDRNEDRIVLLALQALERYIAGKGKGAVVQRVTSIPEPDAELLRLNTEYRALMGEIDAGKHDDEKGALSAEASGHRKDIEKKIADTPAESYTGIAIKLRIAADGLKPEYPRDLETDELNLESTLADAERLAGAASSTVVSETTGDDPFEALAAEWAEQKAECQRLHKAFDEAWERLPRWVRDDKGAPQRLNPKTGLMEYYISGERRELMARMKRARNEAGTTDLGGQSDAAEERLGEIENRIAVTPTTTILGIATKLRVEASVEVEYEFTTTENVIKTALAGAEYLLAQSKQ